MSAVISEYMADSPVLFWPLTETSGSVFRDLVTSRLNHANVSGGVILGGAPRLGALTPPHFNAAANASANRDSSVGPINGASLPFGDQAVTMEVWAYPTSASVAGCLLAYGYQNGGAFTHRNFQLAVAGSAGGAFSDGVNGDRNRVWTTSYTQNKWQHFVFTYAGGTNGACIFYRDAVADTTSTFTLNTTVSPDRVRAGLRSDDARATAYFLGGLCMAAIYATALPVERIQAHYEAVRRSGVSY
jgi:hypothetical protein